MACFLYLVCFSSGAVKFGQTRSVVRRAKTYTNMAANLGLRVEHFEVEYVPDAGRLDLEEQELLSTARQELMPLNGKEWFGLYTSSSIAQAGFLVPVPESAHWAVRAEAAQAKQYVREYVAKPRARVDYGLGTGFSPGGLLYTKRGR